MHQKQFHLSFFSIAILFGILITPALSYGAGVTVQTGARITFSGGGFDLGCTDLIISGGLNLGSGSISEAANVNIAGGILDAGAGSISLSRDWSNNGQFVASSSQVNVVDGCGESTSIVSGDNVFHSFSASSATGKELQVEAGSQQTFLDSLDLHGVNGMLLLIRSTSPGTRALFNLMPSATQDVSYVDVQDNNALSGSLIAPGSPASSNSVDSGNNFNWFGLSVPVPALSLPALLLLVMTLLLAARRRLPLFIKSDR